MLKQLSSDMRIWEKGRKVMKDFFFCLLSMPFVPPIPHLPVYVCVPCLSFTCFLSYSEGYLLCLTCVFTSCVFLLFLPSLLPAPAWLCLLLPCYPTLPCEYLICVFYPFVSLSSRPCPVLYLWRLWDFLMSHSLSSVLLLFQPDFLFCISIF